MLDADGATKITDTGKLENEVKRGHEAVCLLIF